MKKRQVNVKPKRRSPIRNVRGTTTSAPPMPPPVPLEQRLIYEMPFGFNKCTVDPTLSAMASTTWEPSQAQLTEQAWVRTYLADAGCVVAGDIEQLGCTGVLRHEGMCHDGDTATEEQIIAGTIAAGTRLRLGLAGSGVGLPCFVPPTRFCLVHNTIGGLEDEQVVHHGLYIERVSRPLTPAEEAKTVVMRHAGQMKSVGELNDFIAGRSPLDVEGDDEPELPISKLGAQSWTCEEHATTVWSCRYCLAQAVVEGPLIPVTLVASHAKLDADGKMTTPIDSEFRLSGDAGVAAVLKDFEGDRIRSGSIMADVWVRVAAFSRKLARD